MDPEVQGILEKNETTMWSGVISRAAIVLGGFLGLVVTGVLAVIVNSFSSDGVIKVTEQGTNNITTVSSGLVITGVIVLGLLATVWTFLSAIVTKYVVTNKRVLIKTGIIGRDYKSIYYDQVRDSNETISIIDRILGLGTIKFNTGEIETVSTGENQMTTRTKYQMLRHISNPSDVYKMIQTSLSVRKESLYSGRADQGNIQ